MFVCFVSCVNDFVHACVCLCVCSLLFHVVVIVCVCVCVGSSSSSLRPDQCPVRDQLCGHRSSCVRCAHFSSHRLSCATD